MNNKNRRAFLASAAAAVPVAAAALATGTESKPSPFKTCPRAVGGPNAARFPQVVVEDQHKRKAWFYEELLHDKLALVSFTSVHGERDFPVLENLVKVQALLKERLGKDVFMYTVTTEPYRDGPNALKKLAEAHQARWRFLTGDVQSIREVLTSFNVRGRLSGLVWIGNEQTGRWIKRPTQQPPMAIAEVVARLSVGKNHKPFLVDRHSAEVGISKHYRRDSQAATTSSEG
ncbi:MAG: SCO family protein [Methylothermaceae bacterium]|nr:SCO family protein [Methylothermaceae bacterium]